MWRRRKRDSEPAGSPAARSTPAPETVIDPLPELHEFWRSSMPHGNEPHKYLGPVHRSKILRGLLADLPPEAEILEVGCNVGRNLAYLHDNGYPNVTGIEISPHAVQLLRESYPQLADRDIHLGAAEDVLPKLDGPYDLVFTMAVLEHIHPSSTVVFDEIVRLGRSVLAIEPPGRSSHRQYPHDVPALFRERGMVLRSEKPMADYPETARDPGIRPFVAWRFDAPARSA